MTRRFANLALVVVLLACFPRIGSTDDLQDRASAAAKVLPDPFQFFYVPSSGEIADATFIATSRTRGPSSIAKQLSKVLRAAEEKSVSIAVSGPSDAKSIQVLSDAIHLLRKSRLEHIAIVFVGGKSSGAEIEPIVASTGARFVFAEY